MPMPAADQAFVRQHAAAYAASTVDPEEYAVWYERQHVQHADGLEDLPAHNNAWADYQAYLDERGPAPAGDAPQEEWDAWKAHRAALLG